MVVMQKHNHDEFFHFQNRNQLRHIDYCHLRSLTMRLTDVFLAGVFTTCLMNIVGVVIFLRTGWMVVSAYVVLYPSMALQSNPAVILTWMEVVSYIDGSN